MSADRPVSLKVERAFAASGFVLMAVFLIGFWPIAGFLPPPSPSEGAQQIAAFFARDTTAIHLGLWMTMLAAALVVPWAVAISHQLKRIEGARAPLADAQLVLGALLVLEFIIPLAEERAPAHQQQPDGVRPELAAPAAPARGAPRVVEVVMESGEGV
jgi:hypothetical protein